MTTSRAQRGTTRSALAALLALVVLGVSGPTTIAAADQVTPSPTSDAPEPDLLDVGEPEQLLRAEGQRRAVVALAGGAVLASSVVLLAVRRRHGPLIDP